MTPDQEQQLCDALTKLGWLETEHALHSEGVHAIQRTLQCSADDAKAILQDLRMRQLIDITITQGRQLDAREPMPPRHGDGFDHQHRTSPISARGIPPKNDGNLSSGPQRVGN